MGMIGKVHGRLSCKQGLNKQYIRVRVSMLAKINKNTMVLGIMDKIS